MKASKVVPTEKVRVGCGVLDGWLGGGIACKSVTEIVGESSCGKTQLCLQLSLSAQLPPSHGGLSSSSLYLHSEFPFPFRRLRQLSRSFHSSHSTLQLPDPSDRVFVQPLHDAHHLLDLMPRIHSFLAAKRVRLILIDSIAALFRSDFGNTAFDLKRRSLLFFKISGMLKSLAHHYNLAVVVTNQVVDFMGQVEGINGLRVGNLSAFYSSGRRVCPALGLAWSNCVNSRLFLSRNEEIVGSGSNGMEEDVSRQTKRRLHLVFAPHLPPSSCEYVITRHGVFGVDR